MSNLSDSPVLNGKGKRRRVILEDSDEDQEGGGAEEMVGGEESGGVQMGCVAERYDDTSTADTETRVQTPPTSPAPQSDACNGGGGVVIPTPPRRMTGEYMLN